MCKQRQEYTCHIIHDPDRFYKDLCMCIPEILFVIKLATDQEVALFKLQVEGGMLCV